MAPAVDTKGIFSHAESLLEVARLAIERVQKLYEDYDGEELLDFAYGAPVDHRLVLQDMPEGVLRPAARQAYVHAKFAEADMDDPEDPEGDDPEDPEGDDPEDPEGDEPEDEAEVQRLQSDPRARAEELRRRFGSRQD
jgi:hypothetical protein